jgi:hypothetical protein
MTDTVDVMEVHLAEPLFQLDRDVRAAARVMSRADVRWLVDRYYEVQEDRKRAANQLRASGESAEPCRLIEWNYHCIHRYEQSLKAMLGEFAAAYRVGAWLQSLTGFGPVLSAGMLVNFDVSKAPTVGHYWRFAGLDPTLKWPGREGAKKLVAGVGTHFLPDSEVQRISGATGQHPSRLTAIYESGFRTKTGKTKKGQEGLQAYLAKRPWNAKLKSLCTYRLGETQVKFCNHPKSYYGPLYSQKKVTLMEQNERGDFRETALASVGSVGKQTEAYKAYAAGKLPQGQIHSRARRWMVKLFLSHLHHVMYCDYFRRQPPAPYIFEHPGGGDHRHLLEPPQWDESLDGRRLTEMR